MLQVIYRRVLQHRKGLSCWFWETTEAAKIWSLPGPIPLGDIIEEKKKGMRELWGKSQIRPKDSLEEEEKHKSNLEAMKPLNYSKNDKTEKNMDLDDEEQTNITSRLATFFGTLMFRE